MKNLLHTVCYLFFSLSRFLAFSLPFSLFSCVCLCALCSSAVDVVSQILFFFSLFSRKWRPFFSFTHTSVQLRLFPLLFPPTNSRTFQAITISLPFFAHVSLLTQSTLALEVSHTKQLPCNSPATRSIERCDYARLQKTTVFTFEKMYESRGSNIINFYAFFRRFRSSNHGTFNRVQICRNVGTISVLAQQKRDFFC